MLARLHIRNIAVIDELTVDFSDGFNVLTGETGAGKSIIIDSLNMVLGQRTSRDLIRSGQQKAIVEVLFYIDDEEIISELSAMGFETDDYNLLIYRDLTPDG
ncbi:MAG: AAA family ATPase, partial [Clostridiaceae bacterium]|nr:AAA family ATPase [Clostridiaceae bacterium]